MSLEIDVNVCRPCCRTVWEDYSALACCCDRTKRSSTLRPSYVAFSCNNTTTCFIGLCTSQCVKTKTYICTSQTLHLLPIPVGLLVLPCTHQCRRSPLISSSCYRFQSDCSYSLVPASAGGSPLLPPPATDSSRTARTPLYQPVQAVHPYSLPLPFFPCIRQRNR